jgi:hypothetical protein
MLLEKKSSKKQKNKQALSNIDPQKRKLYKDYPIMDNL